MIKEGFRIRVSGPGIGRQQLRVRFFRAVSVPDPCGGASLPHHFFRQGASLPLNSSAAGESLKGARLAKAHRAVLFQPQMANLAAHIRAAPKELSLGDDAASHAGAHGQEDHIAASSARAQFPFHQRTGVRIVLQVDRYAAAFLQHGFQGNVDPAGQIRWAQHHAPAGIQRPAAAHAHGVHVGVSQAVFPQNFVHGFRQLGIHRLKAPFRLRLKTQLVLQMDAAVHRRQQHGTFGSPDVQSHPIGFHFAFLLVSFVSICPGSAGVCPKNFSESFLPFPLKLLFRFHPISFRLLQHSAKCRFCRIEFSEKDCISFDFLYNQFDGRYEKGRKKGA